MALQGSIESFAVVDVLGLLESSSKTGRLIVGGEAGSASLWVADGLAVAGVPCSGGVPHLAVDAAILDLLRFEEGAFVFESGVLCEDPAPGVAISEAIERAGAALAELESLSQRVPSAGLAVSLVPLVGESITLDREAWSTLVGLLGGSTVAQLGHRLGVDEIELLRRVTALLDIGLIELGPDVAPEPVGEPRDLVAPTAVIAAAMQDAAPDVYAPVSFAPESFGGSDTGPAVAAFPATAGPPLSMPDEFAPYSPGMADAPQVTHDGAPVDAARFEAAVPEGLEVLFGDFDPFSSPPVDQPPHDGADWPNELAASSPSLASLASEAALVEAEGDAEDLARQMSVLSPRAAMAVAAAVQVSPPSSVNPSTDPEPEGREHVLRFLDSLQ